MCTKPPWLTLLTPSTFDPESPPESSPNQACEMEKRASDARLPDSVFMCPKNLYPNQGGKSNQPPATDEPFCLCFFAPEALAGCSIVWRVLLLSKKKEYISNPGVCPIRCGFNSLKWTCLLWPFFVCVKITLIEETLPKMHRNQSPDFIFVVFLEWREQILAMMQQSAIVPQGLDLDPLPWRSNTRVESHFQSRESEKRPVTFRFITIFSCHRCSGSNTELGCRTSASYFSCCDPTSWLLAALTCRSCDWQLSGWTRSILYTVSNPFQELWISALWRCWSRDLSCCCVSNSACF